MSENVEDSRILVVLDDTDASLRAVRYVAEFVGRRRQFRICMVQVLPPLPPALQEHGGSGDPSEERRLDLVLRAEQTRWITTAKERAQQGLDQAGAILKKSGVPGSTVQMLFCEPGEPEETAGTLLKMAMECKCHTVVVARQSVSWLHEWFSRDISEELLRRGKGFCVWAVE